MHPDYIAAVLLVGRESPLFFLRTLLGLSRDALTLSTGPKGVN